MSAATTHRARTAAELAAEEAGWRSLALLACPRPPLPALIPGLPGVNACIVLAWREQEAAWRLCRTERHRHGISEAAA